MFRPSSQWVIPSAQNQPHIRLFCFPFAGGSAASYMPWIPLLGPNIQVCPIQLPGRGSRFEEPMISDFNFLVAELAGVVKQYNDLPYAFFGHSFGGLVAFELANFCASNNGLAKPCHLFISGASAPGNQPQRPAFDKMSDQALIDTLRLYGGTDEQILNNKELMELLLPAIRADFILLNQYHYQRRPPIHVPITLLTGRDDTHILREYLSQWEQETTSEFNHCELNGGHFYLQQEQNAILDVITTKLLAQLKSF